MENEKRRMWGKEFDIVENGLDITQVISYIEEIRKVQDTDAHIDSLKRLAESTVAEADRIAQEIREEAKAEAKAKAIEIINEAESKLQQVIKSKERTERQAQQKAIEIIAEAEKQKHVIEEQAQSIIEDASAEAASVRGQARERANKDLERFKEQASEKLREDIRMVHQKLIADLVSLAAEVRILEAKWEGLKIEDIEEGAEISSLTNARELDTPPDDIQQYLKKMDGEVDNILADNLKETRKKFEAKEKDPAQKPKVKSHTGEFEKEAPQEDIMGSVEEPEEIDDEDFVGILIEVKDTSNPKKTKPETKAKKSSPKAEESKSQSGDQHTARKAVKNTDDISEENSFRYPDFDSSQKPDTFSNLDDLEDHFGIESNVREELGDIEQLRQSLESGKELWRDHRLTDELQQKTPDNPILKGLKRSLTNAFEFVKGKR